MTNANPTIPTREGEALDIDAVDAALKAAEPSLSGLPKITQYPSGASNLTYALDYPERRLVLRRPPFGPLPRGGHNMYREYQVMTQLRPQFSSVPRTLFYTDDISIIGAEFYVMDRVEGYLVHQDIPAEWGWGPRKTRKLCEEFFQKLAALHKVDYKAAGLADFGRPEGYIERQISGWNKRFEKAWTDDVETFEDVRTWLEGEKPARESGVAIIHGDYRIDNCILNREDPTIIEAVLDWEIAALGDPLMDLGNTLAYWVEADDPPLMQMTVRQPSRAEGMMSRDEIVAFYSERTGFDIPDVRFYYVYGLFRLAVIIQQIYARYHRGQTRDSRFRDYGKMTNALGEIARAEMHKI